MKKRNEVNVSREFVMDYDYVVIQTLLLFIIIIYNIILCNETMTRKHIILFV